MDRSNSPAFWLTTNAALLPHSGDALDLACGRGRHALWLAARGLRVSAIDSDPAALAALSTEASARSLSIETRRMDLERPGVMLGRNAFDLVVVFHYLHRPLFPVLIDALRPSGVLVYETFTHAQAERGRPRNPAFLLAPGELLTLIAGLTVLNAREGFHEDRYVASVVARKPRQG